MNQIIQIDQLNQIGSIAQNATTLSDKYVSDVSGLIEKCQNKNWSETEVSVLDQVDSILEKAYAEGKDLEKLLKDSRMPITRKLDEVKKHFTTEEKKVVQQAEALADIRSAIQREKFDRIEAEKSKQEAELQAKQQEIESERRQRAELVKKYADHVQNQESRMREKFYSLSIDKIESWGAAMVMHKFEINIQPRDSQLEIEALNKLHESRKYFVDRIPSRIEELKRIADDEEEKKKVAERIEAEKLKAEQEADSQKQEQLSQVENEATAKEMEATMNSMAFSEISIAKGTSVKLKYKVTSHHGMLAIIQNWVTNDMNKMTVEELNKKLSFMRTAADRRLNDTGEELQSKGLEVIEDVRARRYSKKRQTA